MRRVARIAACSLRLLALALGAAGVRRTSIRQLDFLGVNTKKPLPGERKELFPGRRARRARRACRPIW